MQTVAKRVPATISEIEESIEQSLERLRAIPFNDDVKIGLNYLLRPGYRPIVELRQEGRKKRSTASASHWDLDTGNVVIYFEKIESNHTELTESDALEKVQHSHPTTLTQTKSNADLDMVTALQLQQCCNALAEAENVGKSFVALKWFRDEALPSHHYDWTVNADDRQRVLARAIENGAIKTQKIPNPKNPQFPTTTVSLNRTETLPGVTARFSPVPVRGEPVSYTIMRDRGSL